MMKTVITILFLLAPLTASAFVMDSTSYRLERLTMGNAGERTTSSSYINQGTLGQPSAVGIVGSPSYVACNGYWCEAPFYVQLIFDLISGDSDYDGRVIMSDAATALRALVDLGQCTYPMAAASGDAAWNVRDAMVIGQYANALRPATDPLIVECNSNSLAFCPNVAQLVVTYEVIGGACASLENLTTGQIGTVVEARIVDELTRLSENIEVTAGGTPGACDIDAHAQFIDPDGNTLGEARVTFTITIN